MKKIKIMHITHDLNIGGLQNVVVNIAKTIDKSRFDMSVCTLRRSGPLENQLLNEGTKVFKLESWFILVDTHAYCSQS